MQIQDAMNSEINARKILIEMRLHTKNGVNDAFFDLKVCLTIYRHFVHKINKAKC